MAQPAPPPLFSFGVIADAQYADLPDGDTEGRQQLYRQVPQKLGAALAALRAHHTPKKLECVVHLGDIVNGNPGGQGLCDREFEMIACIFDEQLVSGSVPPSLAALRSPADLGVLPPWLHLPIRLPSGATT